MYPNPYLLRNLSLILSRRALHSRIWCDKMSSNDSPTASSSSSISTVIFFLLGGGVVFKCLLFCFLSFSDFRGEGEHQVGAKRQWRWLQSKRRKWRKIWRWRRRWPPPSTSLTASPLFTPKRNLSWTRLTRSMERLREERRRQVWRHM